MNKLLLITLIFAIIVIYILINLLYYKEPFTESFNSLDGVNENYNNDNEYDTLNLYNTYNRYKTVRNIKELNANQWHLRQPGIINQQYNYNDTYTVNPSMYNMYYDIPGTANLNEVNPEYKNKFSAVVDKELARIDYYPNMITSNKPINNKIKCKSSPHYFLETDRIRQIEGNNPNDNLPAQMANRRIVSKENRLASNLMEEIRDEPGYLPMDNIGPI